MCVIVYKPKGLVADLGTLRSCWDRNKDGAGLMFPEGGGLRIAKGFMNWRSFKRYMKRHFNDERQRSMPMAFHFRIATEGSVTPRNCHPFSVNDNLAMMHNGILGGVHVPKDRDISDSEAFVEQYVQYFSSIGIDHLEKGEPLHDLYSKFISGSKLLFMDGEGEVAIINETSGYWAQTGKEKGMWFSNRHWKPWTKASTTAKGSHAAGYTTPSQRAAFGHWDAWDRYYDDDWELVGQKLTEKANPRNGTKALPSGLESNAEVIRGAFEQQDEDWYCTECHEYFMYSQVKSKVWSDGKLYVGCPMCNGTEGTMTVEDLFITYYSDEIWCCFECGASFTSEDSDMTVEVNGEGRRPCPYCRGILTYDENFDDLVQRFGNLFFEAELIDKTGQKDETNMQVIPKKKGGDIDAEK